MSALNTNEYNKELKAAAKANFDKIGDELSEKVHSAVASENSLFNQIKGQLQIGDITSKNKKGITVPTEAIDKVASQIYEKMEGTIKQYSTNAYKLTSQVFSQISSALGTLKNTALEVFLWDCPHEHDDSVIQLAGLAVRDTAMATCVN